MAKIETLKDVLDEAADGRTVKRVHEKLEESGLVIGYDSVRKWFSGESAPSAKHFAPLFDALELDDDQRQRAIAAARR